MSDLTQQLEQAQRAFLQLQIENAQLKLIVLDLRNAVRANSLPEPDQGEISTPVDVGGNDA